MILDSSFQTITPINKQIVYLNGETTEFLAIGHLLNGLITIIAPIECIVDKTLKDKTTRILIKNSYFSVDTLSLINKIHSRKSYPFLKGDVVKLKNDSKEYIVTGQYKNETLTEVKLLTKEIEEDQTILWKWENDDLIFKTSDLIDQNYNFLSYIQF